MASFSANFKKVDAQYCVDGGLSAANVAEVAKDHAGALYLCGDDSGCEGGFGALQARFTKALCCPFDPSNPEFQVGNTDTHRAVLAYKRFEDALDSLPTPTAIMCKSANRASAVLAAYKAVKGKWDKNQVAEYARANGLKFVTSAGLLSWVNTVVDALNSRNGLIFRQLFEKESSTYTYLLADQVTKEAILIDPVLETVARDSALVQDLGLTLKYVINTHVHADHITGTGSLKGLHPGCQSALSAASTGKADVLLNPGDTLTFGTRSVKALPTPGHTAGCVSYVLDDLSRVFTGDALLIRGCGRTDFQGGSAATLYESVHTQLFNNLPPSCLVYPAHDYKGNTCSSIREESSLNPRLTKTLPEFITIMDNLNLPYPAKFDKSVPANLVCGLF